jgi:hypothetical protein
MAGPNLTDCAVHDCSSPANGARGWCRTHYTRWRRHGDPTAGARTDEASRFHKYVDTDGDCHRWTGSHDRNGYGSFKARGRLWGAHQFALVLAGIEVPPGMNIDHVRARGCQHKDCVRVDHLEVVTPGVNTLRGRGPTAVNKRKTHCKRAHEFTPENTWVSRQGYRHCRTCAQEHQRRLVRKRAKP